MSVFWKSLVLIVVLLPACGCEKKAEVKPKASPPATVQNAVRETDLTKVVLTAEAESRLGIQTVAVEKRSVETVRIFGGEVISVPGHSATVTAPVSGTLLPPQGSQPLVVGQHVSRGQPLCRLLLALPESNLLTIQEECSQRQIECDLAQTRLQRARQLLDGKAGSIRQLEDAEAQFAKAKVALETAQVRKALVEDGELDSTAEGLSSLIIKSPVGGVVQHVHVASGQTVTSTTVLVDIVGIDPVWIRVPVYVGDLGNVDRGKAARVHELTDLAGTHVRTAEPVPAPFSADPVSTTADLFYSLPNTDLLYRPGQKVGVSLVMGASEESLIVPYSSILYDMYGSAWVYQNTDPHVYVRQRVALHHVVDGQAVLSHGPVVGARVVAAGAAELFGTEFGVGK